MNTGEPSWSSEKTHYQVALIFSEIYYSIMRIPDEERWKCHSKEIQAKLHIYVTQSFYCIPFFKKIDIFWLFCVSCQYYNEFFGHRCTSSKTRPSLISFYCISSCVILYYHECLLFWAKMFLHFKSTISWERYCYIYSFVGIKKAKFVTKRNKA